MEYLFENHGQYKLFGAGDFLIVTLRDLRADSFRGALYGFGRDVQTRKQFDRLSSCGERHLAPHYSFHAPYAWRRFQIGYAQVGVHRACPFEQSPQR